MSNIFFKRTGDWARAKAMLRRASLMAGPTLRAGVQDEAQALRDEIREGLDRQAPGGKRLTPLSEATKALRSGSGNKALIHTGRLLDSISVEKRGDDFFVGFASTPTKSGLPLSKIAEIHERGVGPKPMSDKQRRYLMARLREAGAPRHTGGARGGAVMRIPPRPFMAPAMRAYRRRAGSHVRRRLFNLFGR